MRRMPRIYAVACALLEQDAMRGPSEIEADFLRAYQTVTPLTMGELWALPIMLRYRLIEQLVQAAARLTKQDAELPEAIVVAQPAPVLNDDEAVADAIVRLRVVNNLDRQQFFETVSLVHQALCSEPADVYAQMTNGSRNRYRSEIERLARHCRLAEHEIATLLVELAQAGARVPSPICVQAMPHAPPMSATISLAVGAGG